MLIGIPFLVKGFFILMNRVASWFGSGYFFKKGWRKKKPKYIVVAVLLSLLMLWGLHWGLKKIHQMKALQKAEPIQIDTGDIQNKLGF